MLRSLKIYTATSSFHAGAIRKWDVKLCRALLEAPHFIKIYNLLREIAAILLVEFVNLLMCRTLGCTHVCKHTFKNTYLFNGEKFHTQHLKNMI